MKKVLEGELLSIAHRILQMKDKEDVNVLYKEAKEVYEKLTVLKFYNDNKPSLENLVSEETLEKQLAIVASNDVDEFLDDTIGIMIDDREQMPADLIQEDTKGVMTNYEEEALEDAKGIMVDDSEALLEDTKGVMTNYEEGALEDTRGVMVDDSEELLEDTKGVMTNYEEESLDDTKGIMIGDAEKLLAEKRLLNTDVVKVGDVLEDMGFEKQRLAYENQFIETPFVDSLEEEESDDLIHSYLDQHEAMLKQKEVGEEGKEVVEPLVDKDIQEAMIHPESAALDKNDVRIEDSFLGFDFGDVDFVRVDDSISQAAALEDAEFVPVIEKENVLPTQSLFEFEPTSNIGKPKKSINDIYNSTISIGLNDRIGFEKHLFNGSAEDFNRVLSQLNTVNSWEEALSFIEDLVKPDYNNWDGKEEYETRFMELVEKRFV